MPIENREGKKRHRKETKDCDFTEKENSLVLREERSVGRTHFLSVPTKRQVDWVQ